MRTTQDGIVGPATISAAENTSDCAARLCDARLQFLKNLKTWSTFGRGWSSRVADVKRKSIELSDRTIIDDVIDEVFEPEPEVVESVDKGGWLGTGLRAYTVAAIVAFFGALATADWNVLWDSDPTTGVGMIIASAAMVAFRAAAPKWLQWVVK